jgi:hypothetical protein
MIFLKIFFWHLARIKKLQNAKIKVWQMPQESGNVLSLLPDFSEWPDPHRFGRISAVLARSGQLLTMDEIWSAGIWRWWPDLGTGSILAIRCCQTPVPTGFRQSTIVEFRQSDIKRACKNEEFNFGKQFTVLKTVNRFRKIKEVFTVKLKMIFVDHYFSPRPNTVNAEIIFHESFYAETNGALVAYSIANETNCS